MKYLVLLSLALVCANSLCGQTKSFMFKPSIESSLAPQAELSFDMYNQDEGGIPPALLIIGGGALFFAGALTEPQGSGYFQILMMAGGLGLATTGVVVAFDNSQSDRWE